MGETLVALPSGGRAWISDVLTHEQDTVIYRHFLTLATFDREEREPGTGERIVVERADLTPEEVERKIELQLATREIHIRACVRRWEGVTDPDGAPLTFPDDLGRMQSQDFDYLFRAVSAVRRGEDLPNSTGPSSAGSSRGSGPKTR